jgi:hypothetical protein
MNPCNFPRISGYLQAVLHLLLKIRNYYKSEQMPSFKNQDSRVRIICALRHAIFKESLLAGARVQYQ